MTWFFAAVGGAIGAVLLLLVFAAAYFVMQRGFD